MSAVIVPNAEVQGMTVSGDLLVTVPLAFRIAVMRVLEKSKAKHNGYVKLGIDVPFKPRTLKASGKFHAIISRLAPLVEMSFNECKAFVKMEATVLGYPMVRLTVGTRLISRPKSEADASPAEEHLLIETALKLGAEAGHDLEAEYAASMAGM